MSVVSVLKYEGDNSTFVWKHPCEDFNTGSSLIVHESQEAIFMLNGELLDVFGPGRHTLETQNLPIIRNIMKLSTGGDSAFHAELYFVNLTEQMAIKWGTDSKISYLDPVYNFPLEIGACGEMSLAVSNASKLLIKVVGTECVLSQEQITKYFRAFLLNRVKTIFAKEIRDNNISIFEIDMCLDRVSEAIKIKLNDDFYYYGVDLKTFFITTVLKPDEDSNYIKFKDIYFRKTSDVMEAELQQKLTLIDEETKAKATVIQAQATSQKREIEGYTYQQEKGFEVAKEVAKNEAIGQMANVGIGLGMISGVGGEIGKTVGSVASKSMNSTSITNAFATARKRFCSNCGKELMEGAMFCSQCGFKSVEDEICPSCGYGFSVGNGNFCPMCGARRNK